MEPIQKDQDFPKVVDPFSKGNLFSGSMFKFQFLFVVEPSFSLPDGAGPRLKTSRCPPFADEKVPWFGELGFDIRLVSSTTWYVKNPSYIVG